MNFVNGNTCNTINCYRNNPSCITDEVLSRSSYVTCNDLIVKNLSDAIAEAGSNVNSEADAEKFLDLVNWNVFVFNSCVNNTVNSFLNQSHMDTQCRSDNATTDYGSIDVCLIEGGCFKADTPLVGFLSLFVGLFFIYGFFTLFGNTFVIVKKLKFITSGITRYGKEKTAFNFLILNLALADIFMGVCVTLFAVDTAMQGSELSKHYVETSLCNAIGITGLLSCQVSVTFLVIISGLRLYGVLRPFKSIDYKVLVRISLSVWFIWIFIAVIPLFEFTNSFFYIGVRSTRGGITDISFASTNKFIETVKQNSSGYCRTVLEVVQRYNSPKILLKVLEELKIVDTRERHFIGIYNKHHLICMANPLFEYEDRSAVVLMLMLFYNLLSFAFIGPAYAIIIKKMHNFSIGIRDFLMCTRNISHQQDPYPGENVRHSENRRMYRIILFIVASDFCVWVPIIIVSFVYFSISAAPHECILDSRKQAELISLYSSFSVFLIITLPVNSAINPYFYSINAWKKMIRKFKIRLLNGDG